METEKSPILAAILSLLIAGLGQLYLNQIKNALIFFILEISTLLLWLFVNQTLGSLLNILISVWSIYYAYVDAKKTKPNKPAEDKSIREIRIY